MKKYLILILFISTIIYSQSVSDYLSFAIVTEDGLVIPIGRYENDKLIDLYSESSSRLYYGDSLEEVYEILNKEIFQYKWNYYSISGEKIILSAGSLVFHDLFDEYPGYGLLIYTSIKKSPSHSLLSDLIGIAFNKEVQYSFFQKSNDDVRKQIQHLLLPIEVDSVLISEGINQFNKNVKIGDKISLNIANLFCSELGDHKIFYYESKNKIDTSKDCPSTLESHGMIFKKKNYSFHNIETHVVDCDGKSFETVAPIALVEYENKLFFIQYSMYYEGYSYSIKRIN